MTQHKHLKQLVRARMAKTGERYAAARRQIVGERAVAPVPDAPCVPFHFPGTVPAAAALRVLLAARGVTSPHTGHPFSEAMVFGIAGGIGIGVFSFLYEQADFASFFVGGRHRWHDDQAYLEVGARRFGAEPEVAETSSAKTAEASLRAMLAGGPCVAWVDLTLLPHRGIAPDGETGGGYHVITIYGIEPDGRSALIGDLTDEPVTISLEALAATRARIKKQKNRLLALRSAGTVPPLATLVREGLGSCHAGLTGAGAPGNAKTNFSLEALRVWAGRLHGSKDRESWERVFPAGRRLWNGLTMLYDFIEHYGTGGGLCRPLFAQFLTEAADATGDARLRPLAEQYAELGRGWSELAEAALPDGVPEFAEAKALLAGKAELFHSGGNPEELLAVRQRFAGLRAAAGDRFPLSEEDCAALRASLQTRVRALYAGEVAAHQALGELLG